MELDYDQSSLCCPQKLVGVGTSNQGYLIWLEITGLRNEFH